MIIEKGDYFVVTRGFEFHNTTLASIFSPPEESWKQNQAEEKPQYSRSENGIVFQAIEVCDSLCVAEVIASSQGYGGYKLQQRISFHLDEIETMVVPKEYVEALTSKAEKEA